MKIFNKSIITILFLIIISISNCNSKYHNGKADKYSSKREDSSLDIDYFSSSRGDSSSNSNQQATPKGFNSFNTNKPLPSLFEEISNRLFYHNDNFNEISNSIYQFGEFIENLKNGGVKNSLKQNKKINKNGALDDTSSSSSSSEDEASYTPSPLSSPSSSILALQQKRLLEKKQARHNHKGNHQYKTVVSSNGVYNNDNLYGMKSSSSNGDSPNRGFKTLGEYPNTDDLEDWIKTFKPELLSSSKNKKEQDKLNNLLMGTKISNVCHQGVVTTTTTQTDTCIGQTCYINELQCNGKNITINSTTPYDPMINYSNCLTLSIICPGSTQVVKIFDLKELYQFKQCNTIGFTCDQEYLSQCPINELLCDGTTQFGKDFFGFQCVNQQLVCNGSVIVPVNKYQQYNESIRNGDCKIEFYPCKSSNEQVLNINLNCINKTTNPYSNCTINYSSTNSQQKCKRDMPIQTCECPLDYMGIFCQKPVPIICELNLISPKANCSGDDYLLSDTHCFTYTKNDSPSFKFNLDCFLAITNETPKFNFNYWINTPNLKITNPVDWSFSNEFINFYRLFNTSMRNEFKLSKDQISGNEAVWFNSTQLSNITSQYFIAKRIYAELSLITPSSSPYYSSNTATLSKFFIYVSDYPLTTHPSSSMSKIKLAFIIIGSVLAFLLLIIAFIFYRNKLKVN